MTDDEAKLVQELLHQFRTLKRVYAQTIGVALRGPSELELQVAIILGHKAFTDDKRDKRRKDGHGNPT